MKFSSLDHGVSFERNSKVKRLVCILYFKLLLFTQWYPLLCSKKCDQVHMKKGTELKNESYLVINVKIIIFQNIDCNLSPGSTIFGFTHNLVNNLDIGSVQI